MDAYNHHFWNPGIFRVSAAHKAKIAAAIGTGAQSVCLFQWLPADADSIRHRTQLANVQLDNNKVGLCSSDTHTA
jgi:uncharacterized circularly permuted ATP-grasp superfamily protein